jgi:hypothetical protein
MGVQRVSWIPLLSLLIGLPLWVAVAAERDSEGSGQGGQYTCGDAYAACEAVCSFIPSDSQANDFAFNQCQVACSNAFRACRAAQRDAPAGKSQDAAKTPVGADPSGAATGTGEMIILKNPTPAGTRISNDATDQSFR